MNEFVHDDGVYGTSVIQLGDERTDTSTPEDGRIDGALHQPLSPEDPESGVAPTGCFVSDDVSDVQPRQRRPVPEQRQCLVDRVVGAHQQVCAGSGKSLRRRQHQTGDAFPVTLIEKLDVTGQGAAVEANIGMGVRSQYGGRLGAERAVTQRSSLCRAGNDSDALGQSRPSRHRECHSLSSKSA